MSKSKQNGKSATKANVRNGGAGKGKTPTDAAPKRMSCLDAAAAVLKAEGKPMACKAMVEAMATKKLWTTEAPTPWATLYSAILREMTTKKGESRFKKTGRGHFALNA